MYELLLNINWSHQPYWWKDYHILDSLKKEYNFQIWYDRPISDEELGYKLHFKNENDMLMFRLKYI